MVKHLLSFVLGVALTLSATAIFYRHALGGFYYCGMAQGVEAVAQRLSLRNEHPPIAICNSIRDAMESL